jgi:hypothetical protein
MEVAAAAPARGAAAWAARCLIWPARRSACLEASAAISRDLEAVSEKISLDFFAVSETSADERVAASAESSCDRFSASPAKARALSQRSIAVGEGKEREG